MRLIIFFIISVLLISCDSKASENPEITTELEAGILTYNVTREGYPNWAFEVLFNNDNIVINELGTNDSGRKFIHNKNSNEILGIYSEHEKYFIYHTREEFINNSKKYDDGTIIKTQEFKNILGYKCQKSVIKYDQTEIEIWTTNKIKPGILYPNSPLIFEDVALEYEVKILGEKELKYVITNISKKIIDKKEFEHIVPPNYHLIVPVSVFAIDSMWSNDFKENTFESLTFPYLLDGRTSTINSINQGLQEHIALDGKTNIKIEFYVLRDGSVSDVEVFINYEQTDPKTELIKTWFEGLNSWTPAKVKGIAVKSKITIFA